MGWVSQMMGQRRPFDVFNRLLVEIEFLEGDTSTTAPANWGWAHIQIGRT